ncbi:transcription-repair-coupling factor [Pseudolysinimonas kribbensis]|uniref:Transcription-repair-coupling factor n=1 Tax=Pseudolysinimonas kribbensis TaxID=433641 RepID=A0ABQ6KBA0_9MICO|nr:transcription-repair-coupling factor [Pseudolysinimonas kribbensis]
MALERMITALERAHVLDAALESAHRDADFSLIEGLRVPLLAALLRARGTASALLAVTATSREAQAVLDALHCYAPDATVLELPAWETLPHERLSPSAETVGRRLHALRAAKQWDRAAPFVLVASVRSALQPLAPGLADLEPLELRAGGRGYDLAALAGRLVEIAYTRVDLVTRRGEFAVRGGILDVFPPAAEHPLRAEFFGDELEALRAFSVADQRSLPETVGHAELGPARELLLTDAVRQRAAEMQSEFPTLQQMLAKIAEGIPVEGMESLAPALLDRLVPLTDYLPPDAAIAVLGPERVATRALHLGETNREFLDAAWSAATAGAQAPIDLGAGDFLSVNGLRTAAGDRTWWTFSPFDAGDEEGIRVDAEPVPAFAGRAEGAADHVVELLRDGWTVAVATAGTGLVERAADVLAGREAAGRPVETFPADPEPGVAYLVKGALEAGFELPEARFAVLSEAEFYGRTAGVDSRQVKRLASRRRNVVDPLQLRPGDIVVHQTHGIGRFVELVKREVASGERTARGPLGTSVTTAKVEREYLVLEYAPSKRGMPGDRLFVPMDQLDLLTRYVGGEAPTLSKMGGSDWAAAKGRARKAVRDIAVELVKLYSARMASVGHAFGPDTPWQRELEEAFPFVETPDQLQTIDEVKADMQRPIPMDRLISGDVGYGKTEVAVRAAFKAVQEGKQVAMLVPTTLLVRQHMETFAERFAGFPVHLRALSRFQTDKEAKDTIAGLASGEVDVVIGTHRLLSDGIRFKDLGLVIIDEEQRFGVEHKDALKKLKTNVDILAMSATPIPRTLEMAVTGIREMSTLATPPEDRHPILTYVGAYNDKTVAAAVRRELLREGQVFFVHNRVSSINRVAAQLAELVPEARIAVAHGQLSEHVLEQVIVDFWERRFDVLVTTTIIETGIDIANANTLIIDRADKYGLSQLHQIRGRVGRGRERAYAYFLYDDDKPLSETATDRLETIAANNELGGGMQIALKDLEIRGAGNLLGGEQSGHIAGVGFDLYLRMIGEAVSAFRGDVVEGQTELRLELPVDAHLPEDYIESERLRLEAYQKLSTAAAATSADDAIDAVLEELRDRYGEPPEQVANLIDVSRLRRRAQKAGLSDVVAMGGNLRIAPAELPDSSRCGCSGSTRGRGCSGRRRR